MAYARRNIHEKDSPPSGWSKWKGYCTSLSKQASWPRASDFPTRKLLHYGNARDPASPELLESVFCLKSQKTLCWADFSRTASGYVFCTGSRQHHGADLPFDRGKLG